MDMVATTLTVTDFVLARIAEDEKAALLSMSVAPWMVDGSSVVMRQGSTDTAIVSDRAAQVRDLEHIARHDPARVLAQCAAMRKIVEEHRPFRLAQTVCQRCEERGQIGYEDMVVEWPCPTMRALASIWSDHPDFDPAWS